MNVSPKPLLLSLLGAVLAGLPTFGLAQSGAAEIGSVQRLEQDQLDRIRLERRLQTAPGAQVDVQAPRPSGLPPGADVANIPVTRFDVSASAVLPDADIEQALAPYVNKTLSLSQLFEATDALNRLYDQRGMPTARAILPPQDIVGGVVRIQLVEARIGTIQVTGASEWDAFIRERLTVQPGDVLSVPALEGDLVRFNRLHQSQLRANVRPGQQTATTDVELSVVTPDPRRITAYVDNGGRNTVGTDRLGIVGQWYGLRLRDDTLTLSGTVAEGSTSIAGNYGLALTPDDWRLELGFNVDRIRIIDGPFEPLDIGGSSQRVLVGVSKPWRVDADRLWRGYARWTQKSSESTFGGVAQLKTDLQVLTLGFTADHRLAGGSVLAIDGQLNHGVRALGGDTSFWVLRLNQAWLHQVSARTQWVIRTGVQLSPTDLLPASEQFQLGGNASVRGYSEGLLTGRNGYLVSAEWRHRIDTGPTTPSSPAITALAFVDHGGAFPFRPTPLEDVTKRDFLTSAGLGVVADWTNRVQLRVSAGWPLRNRSQEASPRSPRWHVQLSSTWP